MADSFYTHRLTKMLEDLVLSSGMTVQISDATSSVRLREHWPAIQEIANAVRADVAQDTNHDGVTTITFRRRP